MTTDMDPFGLFKLPSRHSSFDADPSLFLRGDSDRLLCLPYSISPRNSFSQTDLRDFSPQPFSEFPIMTFPSLDNQGFSFTPCMNTEDGPNSSSMESEVVGYSEEIPSSTLISEDVPLISEDIPSSASTIICEDIPSSSASTIADETCAITTLPVPSQETGSDEEWEDTLSSSGDIVKSYQQKTRRCELSKWTSREKKLQEEAVKKYGSEGKWPLIAKYVGTRSCSQCVNKWKNDLKFESKIRWNKKATAILDKHIREGRTDKEIMALMTDYAYIQIKQHLQKARMNHGPWSSEEVEKLFYLKANTNLTDTEIGHQLNNRHRDDVKKMWNLAKKNVY